MKLTSKNLKNLIREMMSEMASDDYYWENPLSRRRPYKPRAPKRYPEYEPPPERSQEQKEKAAKAGSEGWARNMQGLMSPEQLEIEKQRVYEYLLNTIT